MFGNVKPIKEELKMREYDVFKSYYCGLCKSLGSNYNQLTRFGLNYDLTFLAILLASTIEIDGETKKMSCFVHPLQKRNTKKNSEPIDYASDMSVLLVRYKLKDDWNDDRNYKSLLASIPYIYYDEKLNVKYPKTVIVLKEQLKKLNDLEKSNSENLDLCANAFALIMKEIFGNNDICDEKQGRILSQIGYYLGRWIYIIDAFEDIESDIKSGNFNTLVLKYSKKIKYEEVKALKTHIKSKIETALYYNLSQLVDSYELLEIYQHKEILDNILYLGLRAKMENAFKDY